MIPHQDYSKNIFINCPFDEEYRLLFQAQMFVIAACGYRVRCVLETNDGTEIRFEKLVQLIKESKYSIHDISRTELDSINNLPRFNMPLELGLFLGAKRFGDPVQRGKSCLILDFDRYRYQKFMSDIAGQDIESHNNDPRNLMTEVRNWLKSLPPNPALPGGAAIHKRFMQFLDELPALCNALQLEIEELTYADYSNIIGRWLAKGQ